MSDSDAHLKERAVVREEELWQSFLHFSRDWSESTKSRADIDRRLLLEACVRYFIDIDRKKEENNIEWADAHKRAAFTVKWLLQFKPVQYHSPHEPAEATLANEEFALFIACAYLRIELRDLPFSLTEHILYHFRHELYHPEPWACTFFVLDRCGKNGGLNLLHSEESQ